MASTLIPVAPADGSAPPVAAYHPTAVDPTKCQALRYSADTKDRRWTPMVYRAIQCTKMPVRDHDICERCLKHAQAYDDAVAAGKPVAVLREIDWSGRVGDLASIPAHSHIAGSKWYTDGVVSGTIKWTGVEKPKTTKQEHRLKRRPATSDTELKHFAEGRIELNIEHMAGPANTVTRKQLQEIIRRLGGTDMSGSKAQLCARIRKLKDPAYDPVAEAWAAEEAKAAAAAAKKAAKEAEKAAAKEAAKAEKAAAKEAAKAERAAARAMAKVQKAAAKKAAREAAQAQKAAMAKLTPLWVELHLASLNFPDALTTMQHYPEIVAALNAGGVDNDTIVYALESDD